MSDKLYDIKQELLSNVDTLIDDAFYPMCYKALGIMIKELNPSFWLTYNKDDELKIVFYEDTAEMWPGYDLIEIKHEITLKELILDGIDEFGDLNKEDVIIELNDIIKTLENIPSTAGSTKTSG